MFLHLRKFENPKKHLYKSVILLVSRFKCGVIYILIQMESDQAKQFFTSLQTETKVIRN